MNKSSNTCKVTLDLFSYLNTNDYFEEKEEITANQQILELWDPKLKSAIIQDIKSKFDSLEIDFLSSDFQLTSEDNRGACLFFHKIIITDKRSLEFIKAFIKTLVNHNKTTIYLDSIYANSDKWEGNSKDLKLIYKKLKIADKEFGYFNPINLTELIT